LEVKIRTNSGKTLGCPFSGVLHLDHIIPPQHEGKNTAENRALACPNCNLRKSNKINGVDPVTGQTVRLFHPRKDKWDEHFILHRQTGVIKGLTEIGRVTVIFVLISLPNRNQNKT